MEELLVFALLLCEGFDVEAEYGNRLDEMFLENPTDEMLLDLECMSSNIKQSVLHIIANFYFDDFDHYVFGKLLMIKLKKLYACTKIEVFARRMYSLWKRLPDNISCQQPFHTLSYADDPLSWGDEKQTRELYEDMLNYYE